MAGSTSDTMLDRHALTALTDAIARSDGAAFQNFYKDRAAAVYGLALRTTGDPIRAKEVLQHTFVEIWRDLNSGIAPDEAPDLRLSRVCRRHAAEIVARHGPAEPTGLQHSMTDPVNAGTASFELLALLQVLGRMSPECREALTSIYFDCLTADRFAETFSLAAEEAQACIRRCFAEYRDAAPASGAIPDRETDLLALRQALGLAARNDDTQGTIKEWETELAPFAELVEPVAPPENGFPAIMDRVNASASIEKVAENGRKAEIWRATMYVGIALIAALLIYFGLVAIGDDGAGASIR